MKDDDPQGRSVFRQDGGTPALPCRTMSTSVT